MTAQFHENLILNGEETSMAFCPPLPKNDPRIIELKEDEVVDTIVFCTACWREYIGTWEIKHDKFYLSDIAGRYKLLEAAPILADWFTGILRIPKGKMLCYVHMGFGSVYEEEIHIKIKHGIVVNSKIIDNRNKDIIKKILKRNNFPGFENSFDGDDEF